MKSQINSTLIKTWKEQIRQVAARNPWLARQLWQNRQVYFDRFVHFYRQLANLPRKFRRKFLKRLATTLTGAALMLALGQPLPARAAVITVDGVVCTLAEAIDSANNDNAAGNGCVDGNGADILDLQTDVLLSATLPAIDSEMTLEGNGHTLDGNNSFQVLDVNSSGNLTLNAATITGGNAATFGGGIYNTGTVTLNNSILSSNSAGGSGGGILNSGVLTVNSSTLSDNLAGNRGGGISNFIGTLTLNNSTVSGNSAVSGGGGLNNQGTMTLNNSTLSGNSANSSSGGGIRNYGTLTLNNSTLSGNSAERGGGIVNFSGMVTLSNSTVSGNSAISSSGGGIYNEDTLTLNNSTVSNNSADFGGGINNIGTVTVNNSTVSENSASYNGGGIGNQGTLNLNNSTLSGNLANFGGGIHNNNVGTVTVNRSLISGNSASYGGAEVGNFGTGTAITANNYNVVGYGGDARSYGFTPGANDIIPSGALNTVLDTTLADNGGSTLTHALVSGSVAVDAAPDAPCTASPINGIDQRGYARNIDGDGTPSSNECDAGAFEYASGIAPTPTPTNTPTPTLTPTLTPPQAHINGTDCLLADAITAANTDTPTGDCAAGNPGPDTITLITDVTLSATLPAITTEITLEGSGHKIDGNDAFQVLNVQATGNLALNDATITGGYTSGSGGGIWNFGGTLTLNDSTVNGNFANNYGGGIRNSGALELNNSTVSGNTASSGGGIFNSGTLTLNNSTISGNTLGGGIQNSAGGFAILNLNRSLISGNSGVEISNLDSINANNYNVVGYGGDARSFGFTPGPNDIIPPGALNTVLDTTLADNGGPTFTHALVSGSVAIDTAPDGDCTVSPINGVDQRGYPRNVDGDSNPSSNECDTGAFEYGSALPTPTPTPTNTLTPTSTSTPTTTATIISTSTNTPVTPAPTLTPTQITPPGFNVYLPVVVRQGEVQAITPQGQSTHPLAQIIIAAFLTLANLLFFRNRKA